MTTSRTGRIQVPGCGPFAAPLMMLGEGPGPTEEKYGSPFHERGASGRYMRRCLRMAGQDPGDVRINNAMPVRVRIPSDQRARDALINQWRSHLLPDLMRMREHLRVILAVGGVAARRVAGTGSIMRHNGEIIEVSEIDGIAFPQPVLVIPCLHPAGVMRGKIQLGRLTIQRTVERAVRYATGALRWSPPPTPTLIEDPPMSDLYGALAGQDVVIDTEFNPEERSTYRVGIASNDMIKRNEVFSLTGGYALQNADALSTLLGGGDPVAGWNGVRLKIAQYHYAEIKALGWLGISTDLRWFDTMFAFAALYPDLPCGLDHIARFYLDDCVGWKHMDKADPVYNAIDVIQTGRIYGCEIVDIADANMWDLFEQEIAPTLPLLYGLQERGLACDTSRLRTEQKQLDLSIAELGERLTLDVEDIFQRRINEVKDEIKKHENAIERINVWPLQGVPPEAQARCLDHPTYNGLKGKKFSKSTTCTCKGIHASDLAVAARAKIKEHRKAITSLRGRTSKWERGFDPGNNDHVRWLLYDGLGLRPQRNNEGNLTADATAVAKLIALKSTADAGLVPLLQDIKTYQHKCKYRSTFYDPPLDDDGMVHPPYRMRTGTGRPAGGDDEFIHEKGVSRYAFNALNIPDEVRAIYVPPLRWRKEDQP